MYCRLAIIRENFVFADIREFNILAKYLNIWCLHKKASNIANLNIPE